MILQGFITNEHADIKLSDGNARLLYSDTDELRGKDAGIDKPIMLDPASNEHFFGIEGYGFENYELDKDALIKIQGTILPRPVGIYVYNIIKEYDGTTDVDIDQLRYKFIPTSDSDSGIIIGTNENKPVLELQDYYEIVDGGINYNVGDKFVIVGNVFPQDSDNGVIEVTETTGGSITKVNIISADYVDNLYNLKDDDYYAVFIDGNRRGDTISSEITEFSFYPNSCQYINGGTGRSEYGLFSENDFLGGGFKIRLFFKPIVRIVKPTRPVKLKDPETGNFITDGISDNPLLSISEYSASGDIIYIDSDLYKIGLDITSINYVNKNITNDLMPLNINASIIPGYLGTINDANNYRISSFSGFGQIIQRGLIVYVSLEDKIYDGTDIAPWYDAILERKIDGDEVEIDDKLTTFRYKTKNIGTNKTIQDPNIYTPVILKGKDSENYIPSFRSPLPTGTIISKDITCTVDQIRFIRSTGNIEICYTLHGTITGDNVRISDEGKIVINDNTISKLRLLNTQYDENLINWTFTHTSEESNITVISDQGNTISIKNAEKLNLGHLSLTGDDADNYTLLSSTINDIPFYIVDIH